MIYRISLVIVAILALPTPTFGSVEEGQLSDTSLRVLIVADPDVSSIEVQKFVDDLQFAWTGHGLHSGLNGTPIEIARNGVPIVADIFDGTVTAQVTALKFFVNAPQFGSGISIRNQWAADVVVGLTINSDDACGLAPADQWGGFTLPTPNKFQPKTEDNGLDLRGSEDSFVAVGVIRPGPDNCGMWAAVHEFGHLLGAGHHIEPTGQQWLINEESRASYRCSIYCYVKLVSVMAEPPGKDACPNHFFPTNCVNVGFFSDGTNDYFKVTPASGYDNVNALATTARSVANYRAGIGDDQPAAVCLDGSDNDGDAFVDGADPDCAICQSELCPSPPPPPPPNCSLNNALYNIFATLTATCAPNPPTGTPSEYRIEWEHPCPQEVDRYEIWQEFPPGNVPQFRWTTYGRSTTGLVDGGSVKVLIRACGEPPGSCSLLYGGPIVVDRC